MNTLALNGPVDLTGFLTLLGALPKCAEIARHMSELSSLYTPIRYDKPTSSFHNPKHIAPCLAQIINELYSAGNSQPMDRIKRVVESIPSRILETLEALKKFNYSWNEKARECAFHIANLLGSCSEHPQKMVDKFSSIEKMALELQGNIKEAIKNGYSELERKEQQMKYSMTKKDKNQKQIKEISRSIQEVEKQKQKSTDKVKRLEKRIEQNNQSCFALFHSSNLNRILYNSMFEVNKITNDIREMGERIEIIERENRRLQIDSKEMETENKKTSEYLRRLRDINSYLDIWITESSRARSVWISIKMHFETVNAKDIENVLLGFQSRNLEDRKYASNQLIHLFESLDFIFIALTIYDAVKERFVNEKLETFLLKMSTRSDLQESDEKPLPNLNLIENEVFNLTSEMWKAAFTRHNDKMKKWRTFFYYIQ